MTETTTTSQDLRTCRHCHGNGWEGRGPYRAEVPCRVPGHREERDRILAEAAARPSAQAIALQRIAARKAARLAAEAEAR